MARGGESADELGAASIATFVPEDRALSPPEIRLMHRQLEQVATYPTIRLALRLILLTLVRKSELIEATWDEVDFEAAVWTISQSTTRASVTSTSCARPFAAIARTSWIWASIRRSRATLLSDAGPAAIERAEELCERLLREGWIVRRERLTSWA
jgi:integrase